jgi:hypothetical protein
MKTIGLLGTRFTMEQDKLAPRVSFCCLLVGLARLGKGEHRVDDGPELSRINQCANLGQFIAVGFNHKPGKAHVMSLCHSSGRWGTDDGDKHSCGFDHLPGALQGVAANRIEDQIDIMDHLLEACGGVVDDLVGPQFAQEVAIACRGGRDDLGPRPMNKLDGKDSNAPCGTVDQDALPRSEVRVVKEGLPGCQR